MRTPRFLQAVLAFLFTVFTCAALAAPDLAVLQQQVADTERAFAATMAKRDHAAFTSFIATEALFLSKPTLRGKEAVAAGWKPYFDKPEAPFSWTPERVEVLDSGTLALSTGPVWNAAGKRIGTFSSIWRLEAPGTWRIIFDKGEDFCDCKKP